jgi:hypothetical protein
MANAALMCNSPLLTRALERFLAGKLTTVKECDLVIGDHAAQTAKPLLIIGEHLPKPFSKSQLLETLERFEKLSEIKTASTEMVQNSQDKEDLEEAIARLTDRFAKELLELIRHK